jgi:hypothetical protein
MQVDKSNIKLIRQAKGKRPTYLPDPTSEKILAMVMALAGEVSVMRDRLETMERLSEKSGVFSSEDIENYVPSDEEKAAREERRAEYLRRIFRSVQDGIDGLGKPAEDAKETDGA